MNKIIRKWLYCHVVIALLLLFVSTALPPSILAQTASKSASFSADLEPIISLPPREKGMNVTISPVFINLSAFAGKSVKSSMKIANNNDFAERYQLFVSRFKPDEKGESIIPIEPDPNDNMLKWLTISKSEIVVEAKSQRTVEFQITVPEDAFLGYYFGISVRRAQEQFNRTDTTKMVGEAVMPILLEVKRQGDKGQLFVDSDVSIYKKAEIVSFNTSSWWYEYVPVSFDLKIRNSGKIHIVPFGDIIIQQGSHDVGSIQFNENGGNTLPGSIRSYKSQWADGFIVRQPVTKDGTFVLDKNGNKTYSTSVNWDSITKFRIGRYTAKAMAVYNNGRNDVPIEAMVSFWIIPWKILLLIALVIAVVVFGIKSAISGLLR